MATTAFAKTGGLEADTRDVASAVKKYSGYHDASAQSDEAKREQYADMVNHYYDLSTTFYEYGWGESFHFGHRLKGETHDASLKRHEHYLALKLGLKAGQKCLDLGCGVGGPLREIVRFTSADVTGLNNNEFQVDRANAITAKAGAISQHCSYVKGDFMAIPCEPSTFDAAYQIEATCHAPDAVGCYREIFRTLKPGGHFAGYEWCTTDSFDGSNPEHDRVKRDIEIGNGLPDIRSCTAVVEALEAAGFEVLESEDLTKTAEVAWYETIDKSTWRLENFKTTQLGRSITKYLVKALELVRLAPAGSSEVSSFLETGADALVEGGKRELFTPMFFFVARKPTATPAVSLSVPLSNS